MAEHDGPMKGWIWLPIGEWLRAGDRFVRANPMGEYPLDYEAWPECSPHGAVAERESFARRVDTSTESKR